MYEIKQIDCVEMVYESPRNELTAEVLRAKLNYDELSGVFTWRVASPRGRIGEVAGGDVRGYRRIRVNYGIYFSHRLAWLYVHGKWPTNDIDHINGIKNDNRIKNLRDVTHSVNMENQVRATRTSKTGFLGSHPHRDKFGAQITFDGKIRHLGLFGTAAEGHQAYLIAKRALHEGCTI